ncbi:MAG TPA: DegT/DnrJ/EryC1/StrS family aminotransferase [Candidatus Acidoferrales bacterium]|nr:DegT/DnrJ/EryC1/StrS family aminotransferase [Candidatus Acidoferrales bacterium]
MPAANPPPPIPLLDLVAQFESIQQEIQAAIEAVLRSGHFILGPQVQAFEQEIAKFCGTRHAVGVASGTDALLLSLRAAGVGPGDEVLVPAFSYIATADAVSLLGATPVFCEVLPDTFNLDPAQLEGRITPRTKAVVPVHLFGQTAEMERILSIARAAQLAVIEDAAQAIGASRGGRPAGSLGDFGCLSFYPTKNLGACGDAGMVLTSSAEDAARLRSLRGHGTVAHKYISEEQGWNSRLDELQAAILRVKLRHLAEWTAARQSHAARYEDLLRAVPGITLPRVAPGSTHVYHQYTIRVPEREHVQKHLAGLGIATAVYYPVPLHLQPMYAHLGQQPGSLPRAERASLEVLSLPIYPELATEQIERIAAALAEAVVR